MNGTILQRLSAIALVAGLVLVLSGATSDSQPRIEFEEEEYDWGEVMEGDTVTHDFRFQNTGNEVLAIHKVRSG